MATPNPLVSAVRSEQVLYGGWCMLSSPYVAEVLSATGFDYVCVDMQHGMMDFETAITMIQAIDAHGVPAISRVPENNAAAIGRILDVGAAGIIVPMVNTAEEAAAAVAACRYAPTGVRSFGPLRASLMRGTSDTTELADVLCAVMVETREGLENVEEIAAVDGIDAIYVGPADLAISLGLPASAESDDPSFHEAIARITKACAANEIAVGIHCLHAEGGLRWAEQGFRILTVATDAMGIGAFAAEQHRAVHAAAAASGAGASPYSN